MTDGSNPTVNNDTIAQQTKWTPMNPLDSNVVTHKLTQSPTRIMLKETMGNQLSYLWFLFAFIISLWVGLQENNIPIILLGTLILYLGVSNYRKRIPVIAFDKQKGQYVIGRSTDASNPSDRKGKLDEIFAIQVMPKHFLNEDGYDTYCFETNLVLKDSSRIHLTNQYDYTTVERQHNALKDFLQIQLWLVPHPEAYKYRVIHARDQT